MIRASTIATLIAIFAFSECTQASLRGGRKRDDSDKASAAAPLDVDLVVESIAYHLWHSPKSQFSQYPPSAFVVKGSYPAAIKALEDDPNLALAYNDIDVFLLAVTNEGEDCNQRLHSVQYVEDIIPGQTIEVNLVEMCDFSDNVRDHAEDTDINAASVAFKVVPTMAKGGNDDEALPEIDSWATTNGFDEFLSTNTLAITKVGMETRPAHSVIRLMKKAEQLGLDYEIPMEGSGSLRDAFHGAQFSKLYKKRLDALGEKHLDAFYNLFDVLRPNKQDHRYTLAVKGMPTPSHRKLASGCIYDEVDLDCFYGVLSPIQLQGGQTYSFSHLQDEYIYIGLLEGEQDTVEGAIGLAGGQPSFTFVPPTPGIYTPYASGAESCHDGETTFHVTLKTCLVQP